MHEDLRAAAAFVSGAMSRRRARRFEAHILSCEDCWREVSDGRDGRALAESLRELPAQELRERIRTTIAAAQAPRRSLSPVPVVVATLALLAAGGFVALRTQPQPAPIAAALSDYRSGRMPNGGEAATPAPDLTGARLTLTNAGAGMLHDQPVDAFTYYDGGGRRVVVYMSDDDFPIARGAQHRGDGPWRVHIDGVTFLCASTPHPMLLVADDDDTLARAGRALGISL